MKRANRALTESARLQGEVERLRAERSLNSLVVEIQAWQRATFTKASPESVAAHLLLEAAELKDNPCDPHEIADCFLLICGSAQANGYDLTDLVARKFAIAQSREWGEPDAEGVVRHLTPSTSQEAP